MTLFSNETQVFVEMKRDFTTSSCNLGERTFKKSRRYCIDVHQIKEMLAEDVALRLSYQDHKGTRADRPERPLVPVKSCVSRWFTSDGIDTWQLAKDAVIAVPSNLAVWLDKFGYASIVRNGAA